MLVFLSTLFKVIVKTKVDAIKIESLLNGLVNEENDVPAVFQVSSCMGFLSVIKA